MKHTMSPISLPPPAMVENKLSPPSPLSLPQLDKRGIKLKAIQQENHIKIKELLKGNIKLDAKIKNLEKCRKKKMKEAALKDDLKNEVVEPVVEKVVEGDEDEGEEEVACKEIEVGGIKKYEEEFLDSTSVISSISSHEEEFLDSSRLEIEIPSQSNSPELGMILHNLRGDSPCSSVDIPSFFLDSSNEDRFSDSRDGFVGFSESNNGDGNVEHGNQEDEV